MLHDRRVLLLNSSWMVMSTISWKKAVDLVLFRQRAEVISEYTNRIGWFSPSIVRLVVHSPDPYQLCAQMKFSKTNLLIRDKMTCQYCARKLTKKTSTIDHVLPKCRGGNNSWTNVVVACAFCNSWKKNLLPHEAGMRLLRPPKPPSIYDVLNIAEPPIEWMPYLQPSVT